MQIDQHWRGHYERAWAVSEEDPRGSLADWGVTPTA